MTECSPLAQALRSKDLLTRVKACSEIGRSLDGHRCLPILKQFVIESSDTNAEDACVAVRAIGEILRRQASASGQKLPAELAEYVDFLLLQLEKSNGRYSSSLVFALCLVGETGVSQRAIQAVVNAVARAGYDNRMKYRAYQYACSVKETLLSVQPWSTFIPPTNTLRDKWDIDRILKDYG